MGLITAEQVKASRRILQLADEAMRERKRWTNVSIRSELLHIAKQLEQAGRMALSSSEAWGDAWSEAGVLTMRKYVGRRKLIEHTVPR